MIAPASSALERILAPLADCLTPESAEKVARFQVDADTRIRIDELAAKANEGAISDAERAEYLDFVEAMDLIGIFQDKARQILVRRSGS
jgi:hypothetical protein